jgi:hypothetical protein
VSTDLPAADLNSEELEFEDAQDSHSLPEENIASIDGEQHVAEPETAAASSRPSLESPDIDSAIQNGTGT